jgi:hypothetical protein
MRKLPVAALAFVLLIGGAGPAEDKKDEKKPSQRQATEEGRVKAADPKARTVTIYRPYDPKSKDVIVTFGPDALVFIDGKEGKFEDVPVGKEVFVRVIGGKVENSRISDATELQVGGRHAHGWVRKLTAESITYTPETALKEPDVTAKLAPDVRFLIGGKEVKVTDIKVGEKVGINYTADGKLVLLIARTAVPMKK